jgi:hypothetical protein
MPTENREIATTSAKLRINAIFFISSDINFSFAFMDFSKAFFDIC